MSAERGPAPKRTKLIAYLLTGSDQTEITVDLNEKTLKPQTTEKKKKKKP